MFLKSYTLTFLTFLTSGSILSMSSNSWFTAWVGLEINLMRIIPLLLVNLNTKATEASIKYFLSQALASIILISASIGEIILSHSMIFHRFNRLILISLIIKIGMAPFHFWFPQVINSTLWFQGFLILTWQKIAPFTILSYFNSSELVITAVILSSLVGAIGGLNQTNLKLILTYSSIAHTGWIIILCSISLNIWFNYFLIYSLITATLVPMLNFSEISSIKEINSSKLSSTQKYCILVTILSLGGLPPFLGFYAKLSAIIIILSAAPTLILMVLILSSLVSLFYYLKLTYNILIISTLETNIFLHKDFSFKNIIFIAATLGNIFAPVLILLT